MISVIIWCGSMQSMLDATLKTWMNQVDVDYEIIIGYGPGIKIPVTDKRITLVHTPDMNLCRAYNMLVEAAHGDILCITYCDMQINSNTQLKRMLDKWTPRVMVTDKVFRNGKRIEYPPVFFDMSMVSKEAIQKAGGWCELFVGPDVWGHEDGDLVATMLEQGMTFEFIETPDEEAVYHITHPSPNLNDPAIKARMNKGKEIFHSRHPEGIMALYAKQLLGRSRTFKL